jgi:hypothetical protein
MLEGLIPEFPWNANALILPIELNVPHKLSTRAFTTTNPSSAMAMMMIKIATEVVAPLILPISRFAISASEWLSHKSAL